METTAQGFARPCTQMAGGSDARLGAANACMGAMVRMDVATLARETAGGTMIEMMRCRQKVLAARLRCLLGSCA